MKKCHQRLYFLRKIKKFGVGKQTLIQFYRATVESVLSFSVTAWFGALSVADKTRLNRIVATASKIIGTNLEPLTAIYQKRTTRKVKTIITTADHPGRDLFNALPSGRRFRSIQARTERFRNSFYVKAVSEFRL